MKLSMPWSRWGALGVASVAVLWFCAGCEHGTGSASHNDTNIVALTKATFDQEVIASPQPVLVDFYADWCGPCKTLAPTVSALAAEYLGRVKFAKVDVDRETALVDRFNVEGYPTLILFKDGKSFARTLGVVEKGQLKESLESALSGAAAKAAGK